MDKKILVQMIMAEISAKGELYVGAAQATYAEAVHEESRAEDPYDTHGLEASYLAAGQSRQAAEAVAALEQYKELNIRKFGPQDPIDVGALVQLEMQKERTFYFLGPAAGGTEVTLDNKTILVLTPQSPLGQQLKGRKTGDRMKIKIAGVQNEYHVAAVH